MGNPIPPEMAAQIEELLVSGDKIRAIKVYRAYSGQGLMEAKDFVETLERELRAREPDRFTACSTGQRGCLGLLLVLVVLGGILGLVAVFCLSQGILEVAPSGKQERDSPRGERESSKPQAVAEPQPAAEQADVTVPQLPLSTDLTGTWHIAKPPKIDRKVKLARIDESHYRLTPDSLAFHGVYTWDGKTLSMESGNPGYPNLTWHLNEPEVFTIRQGGYAGTTMSKAKPTPEAKGQVEEERGSTVPSAVENP